MDDELNRAAQRQKVSQRQGADRAKRRQREEEERRRQAALSLSLASGDPSSPPRPSPSAASSAVPEDAAGTASSSSKIEVNLDELEVPCPGGPYNCFICLEPKDSSERFLPHRCSTIPQALCCRPCFVAWVESQIDAEAAVIKCCHCDLSLEAGVLARLVDAEHCGKYFDLAVQRNLRRDASFIWCSKCKSGGWVDPKQPPSQCGWTCPECSNSFVYCSFCRREHGSLTCKKFQEVRREIFTGGHAAKDKAGEGLVQRTSKMCPSCKMPIQKDGGCNFMDCPNCRRHFCWSCGRILKGSHQKHHCDAGFEGSAVVHKTPNGQVCVEFTRLFTNVLDLDNVEVMNGCNEDVEALREMLVPGLSQEPWSPLFVGPSECDGELVLTLPFNFTKSMSWELTHILFRATHPPAPLSYPPRSVTLIVNVESVSFSDFDDVLAITVPLEPVAGGALLARLEPFFLKGTFRRVTFLAIRLSVNAAGQAGADDMVIGEDPNTLPDDAQVFINDIALFGVPGDKVQKDRMWDDRANLIVSPVLTRRRWGEEIAGAEKADGEDDDVPAARVAEAPVEAEAGNDEEMAEPDAASMPAGRRGLPMPMMGDGAPVKPGPTGARAVPERPQEDQEFDEAEG